MAADSAVSEADTGTKCLGEKLSRLGAEPILYGSSGSVGLRQRIDDSLKSFKPKTNLKQLRNVIKSLCVSEQKAVCDSHVPYPDPSFHRPPLAILLFAGVLDGTPWILEIERNGEDTLYDEKMGCFAAIGIGKTFAHAVYRSHLYHARSLQEGRVQAYRVVEDAINIGATGLAEPIQISTIDAKGAVEEMQPAKLRQLKDFVNTWRAIEHESLGLALSPANATPSVEAPIPKPESSPSDRTRSSTAPRSQPPI